MLPSIRASDFTAQTIKAKQATKPQMKASIKKAQCIILASLSGFVFYCGIVPFWLTSSLLGATLSL